MLDLYNVYRLALDVHGLVGADVVDGVDGVDGVDAIDRV